MRIKVNPKEKSLTGNKMKRGRRVAENNVKRDAELCTFISTLMT